MSCSVARFTPQNPASLAALESRAGPHGWNETHYRDALAAGYVFFGLFSDTHTLRGLAVVMSVLDEAEILNIVIDRDWQGQGLGRSLLENVQQALRQQGSNRLFLEVRASNTAARKLYSHCHFQACGVRKNYYPSTQGREDAILMEARL